MTDRVEQDLLLLIEKQRVCCENNKNLVESDHYIQLADHYHAQKKFSEEVAILNSLVNLVNADRQDFVEIYERIDRISHLNQESRFNSDFELVSTRTQSQKDDLMGSEVVSGVDSFSESDEKITIVTKPVNKPTYNANHQPFSEKTLYVLTLCAMYTGREDKDEIFQLSLVLFEYNHSRDKKLNLIKTFVASRKTNTPIPKKRQDSFNLKRNIEGEDVFDKNRVISLFQQADFVVGHNDADIERKLLSVLIPEISTTPWYSSQKDIPWSALGFESRSLSKLCLALGEKIPKNSLERAMAICKILLRSEPCQTQIYLQRLYNAHPMKPFEWTPALIEQHQRLANSKWSQLKWAIIILFLATFGYLGLIFL